MSPQPQYLNPDTVATTLGHYSHLSRVGDLILVAGQVGVDPGGELAGPDLESQTRQTYANLAAVLESQGGGLRDVLKFATYLVGAANIERFFAVRVEIFPELYPDGQYPPNTLLVVERLVRPEFLVEIEAIAYLGENPSGSVVGG